MFKTVKYQDGDNEETTSIIRPGKVFATFKNGDTFEGHYVNAGGGRGYVRTGKGRYVWSSNAIYDGDYKNGKRHGQGTYTFPSGEVYEGLWDNGVKAGKGKYSYTNGDVFYGIWVDDKRHGPGRFVNASQRSEIIGEWVKGTLLENTFRERIIEENDKAGEANAGLKPKEESKPTTPIVVSATQAKDKTQPPMEQPKAVETEAVSSPEIVNKETPVKSSTPTTFAVGGDSVSDGSTPVPSAKSEAKTQIHAVLEPKANTSSDVMAATPASAAETAEEVLAEEAMEKIAEDLIDTESVVIGKKALGVIIAGPPASGKGTVCEKIAEHFGFVHLSTGDMLREAVRQGTPTGLRAKEFMDKGDLVPDEVVIGIVEQRIKMADCQKKGFLLDGFPRTKEQAEALDAMGVTIDVCLLLDVADHTVIQRACGRRLDPVSKRIYHLEFDPPPEDEEIKKRLIHRSDDTEESMVTRLEKFRENVGSFKEFYAEVTEVVDGNVHKNTVWDKIKAALVNVQGGGKPAGIDVGDGGQALAGNSPAQADDGEQEDL